MKVIVNADGGSRGNPGPAGYGAVVRDVETGDVLVERKGSIGVATNNVAEYTGLIEGLQAALDVGATEVDFRADSKLVVEQMSGRWKIKNAALQPLALQARELASQLQAVRYQWVPRAQNSHADRLANEAMDAAEDDPEPAADGATRPQERGTRPQERGTRPQEGGTRAQDGGTRAQEQLTLEPEPEPAASMAAEPARPVNGWLPTEGTPTRLILLRHGQTPLSVERRYSGRRDVALTDVGRRQAADAAKRIASMGIAQPAVVSSPLQRAVQTATAVADELGVEVAKNDGLIETDFGEWDGMTFAEVSARDPQTHGKWLADASVRPPQGESFDTVLARVRTTLDELLRAHAGGTVIAVSHVSPIKMLLRLALDAGPSLLYRLHLDLASVSIVDFYPDGNASVSLVNDTSHLR